jgi:hypothetical protein
MVQWFGYSVGAVVLTATLGVSVIRQAQSAIGETLVDVLQPAHSILEHGRETVTQTVADTTTRVVEGLRSINQSIADEGVSMKSLCAEANKHKIGLTAAIHTASSAHSASEFISSMVTICSMLGLEQSVVNSLISRLTSSVVPNLEQQGWFDDVSQMWSTANKSTWDQKRLMGLSGLVTTLFGYQVSNHNILEPIQKAQLNAASLEKSWDMVEEYLNSLGIVNSGKWAYLKEIEAQLSGIQEKFEDLNRRIASAPAQFCRPDCYREWIEFRDSVARVETICRKNMCGELRNSKVFVSVQTILAKTVQWDALIAQARSTNGIRVHPVGVVLQGASQLGKSTLWNEIARRVRTQCYKKFQSDPIKYEAFSGAMNWQTWAMQSRDEYDQGYGGQEFTYADDGFSDRECKDHQIWLSFISGQAIGTVQADLSSKGLAYNSRLACVSCNILPEKSTTINNVGALQERFPVTVMIRLKKGSVRKTPSDPYDAEFSHLELTSQRMSQSCALSGARCKWAEGSDHTCGAESTTVSAVVDDIVARMCAFEEKFQTQMDSLFALQTQGDDDTESSIDSELFQYGSSASETSSSSASSSGPSIAASIPDEPLIDLHAVDQIAEFTGATVDLGLPYPAPSGVPSVVDAFVHNLDVPTRMRLRMLEAFRAEPVVRVSDPRIYSWAKYLVHKQSKQAFVAWLEQTETYDAYSFMLSLNLFSVQEEYKDEFLRTFAFYLTNPVRFRDAALELDYVFGLCLNNGTKFFGVPCIEGTIDEFDTRIEEHRLVLELCLGCQIAAQRVPNTDFELFKVAYWGRTTDQTVSNARAILRWTSRVTLDVGLAVLLTELGTPIATMHTLGVLTQWITDGWRPRNVYSFSLNSRVENHHSLIPARTVTSQFIDGVCWVAKKIWNGMVYTFDAIKSFCSAIGHRLAYALYRVCDWLGISVSDYIVQWTELLGEAGGYALVGTLIAVALGIAAAFVSYSLREKAPKAVEPQYHRTYASKSRRDRPKMKMVRRALVRHATKHQSADVAKILGKTEKLNYYEAPEQECPFCDPVTRADGQQLHDCDGWEYRENKFPLWNRDILIMCNDHDMTNPLDNGAEGLQEELEAAMRCASEQHRTDYYIERNYGQYSGGSVPHPHIKVMWDVEQQVNKDEPKTDVLTMRQLNLSPAERGIEIVAVAPAGWYGISNLMEMLDPLFQNFNPKSWNMVAHVQGESILFSFYLLSTVQEDKEVFYSKATLKAKLIEMREFFGEHKWNLTKLLDLGELVVAEVLATNMEPQTRPKDFVHNIVSQSCDDAALGLLRDLTTKLGVSVRRATTTGYFSTRSEYSSFDDAEHGWTAGVAYGKYIICPQHIAHKDQFLKVRQMSGPLKGNPKHWKQPYMVAKCIRADAVADIAILTLLTVKEAERQLSCAAAMPVKLSKACEPIIFSSMLRKHLMTEQEFLDVMDSVPVCQYLPTTGMVATGVAHFAGTRILMVNGERETHTTIEVYGVNSEICATQTGDCGGLLVVMNSKVTRKVAGFHVAGHEALACSSMLTLDVLDSLIVPLTVESQTNPENGLILDPHPKFDSSRAGHGSSQIVGWPVVTWVEDHLDGFSKFIVRDRAPVDLPEGEDVKFVGRLIYEHACAPTHSGAQQWHKSPFFGAFPVKMVPSAMKATDRRITDTLPRNGADEPSLLMRPNSIMGRVLPNPDSRVLTKVFLNFLQEWAVLFSGKKLGSPKLAEEVVGRGMNGIPFGQFMTGMEVNSSCGVPWNWDVQFGKKSKLIDVDPTSGHRSIADNQVARHLLNRCVFKLHHGQHGRRAISFCASKLKDCLVKETHVAIGKTRVFNCSSVEDVIVGNGLFAAFKEAYMSMPEQLNHSVGIDVHSYAWEYMYKTLAVFPNWGDVDYSNYDKHLPSVFMRLAYMLIIKTIERVDADDWTLARYVYAESCINSLMVDNTTVYMTEHSNKSGDVMTTIINGIVNQLFMHYCFSKALDDTSFIRFRAGMRFRTFGDDIVLTVADHEKQNFDLIVLFNQLTAIGQEATPADKVSENDRCFGDKQEVTFLKRKFRQVNNRIICPLSQTAIEAVFGWTKLQETDVAIWAEIVDSHLMEATLWGKEYYDYFKLALAGVLSRRWVYSKLKTTILPLLVHSYEDALDMYMSRKLKLLNDNE